MYGMYFCPRCRNPKSYESFYRHNTRKHAVYGWCKECFGERQRKREKNRAWKDERLPVPVRSMQHVVEASVVLVFLDELLQQKHLHWT